MPFRLIRTPKGRRLIAELPIDPKAYVEVHVPGHTVWIHNPEQTIINNWPALLPVMATLGNPARVMQKQLDELRQREPDNTRVPICTDLILGKDLWITLPPGVRVPRRYNYGTVRSINIHNFGDAD